MESIRSQSYFFCEQLFLLSSQLNICKKRYNILKFNPHPGHTYIDDDVVMMGWTDLLCCGWKKTVALVCGFNSVFHPLVVTFFKMCHILKENPSNFWFTAQLLKTGLICQTTMPDGLIDMC